MEKFLDLSASWVKSIDLFNGNLLIGLRNGTISEYENFLEGEESKESVIL